MAIHIQKSTEIAAPVEKAFAYVADYKTIGDWLFGIKQFTPVGEKDYGLDAVFDGEMHVGATLHSTVKVTDWEDDRVIELDSVKGFKNTSRWTFEPVDDRSCRINADISYELPGGIAGKALGKVISPFIQIAVNKSSESLAKQILAI